jgi:peptidoglycan hydrolase CwlO-like protein
MLDLTKMKIDLTKILLFALVVAVIILGYGVFRTKDSPEDNDSKLKIAELNKDKAALNEQVSFLQLQYNDFQVLLKQKDLEIENKNKQIKNLQNKLREKIDSIGHLDNNGNLSLLSSWLSENN